MSNIEKTAVQPPANTPTKQPFQSAVIAAKPTFTKIYGEKAEQKFLTEYGFAVMQAKNNPMLAKCNPDSVKNALIQVALTNLTLNPVRQSAYLVPRGKNCTLDIGYQGMIDILVTSGSAKSVYGNVILKDEAFEYEQSTESAKLIHKPNMTIEMKEDNCIGAYCIITLPNGEKQPFVMRKSEILEHKNASSSKGSDYSPWNGAFWKSMYIKTVIRYAYKFLPKSDQGNTMIEVLNQANPVNFNQEPQQEIIQLD